MAIFVLSCNALNAQGKVYVNCKKGIYDGYRITVNGQPLFDVTQNGYFILEVNGGNQGSITIEAALIDDQLKPAPFDKYTVNFTKHQKIHYLQIKKKTGIKIWTNGANLLKLSTELGTKTCTAMQRGGKVTVYNPGGNNNNVQEISEADPYQPRQVGDFKITLKKIIKAGGFVRLEFDVINTNMEDRNIKLSNNSKFYDDAGKDYLAQRVCISNNTCSSKNYYRHGYQYVNKVLPSGIKQNLFIEVNGISDLATKIQRADILVNDSSYKLFGLDFPNAGDENTKIAGGFSITLKEVVRNGSQGVIKFEVTNTTNSVHTLEYTKARIFDDQGNEYNFTAPRYGDKPKVTVPALSTKSFSIPFNNLNGEAKVIQRTDVTFGFYTLKWGNAAEGVEFSIK